MSSLVQRRTEGDSGSQGQIRCKSVLANVLHPSDAPRFAAPFRLCAGAVRRHRRIRVSCEDILVPASSHLRRDRESEGTFACAAARVPHQLRSHELLLGTRQLEGCPARTEARPDVFPEIYRRGVRPDIVTDQTSAHDPTNGYLPQGWKLAEWREKRESDPKAVEKAARASMKVHVQAMVDFWNDGVPTLDYGNNIRQVALDEGLENAFAFPGFVPAYIRPLFCRGIGPFRWCALSGDPEDIYKTDAAMKELFPENTHLHKWLDMARERISFQGLPARICWIGLGDRHRAGLKFNEMVASGELKAPVVIGRDHLDSGSVASPNRETEAMKDGSDAVSDWPLLNALINTASGATWVSLHHGGGVGMGFSQHAGLVIVADGTPEAAKRLERVLWNDPASGVWRHADAGYEDAVRCAKDHGLRLPGILGN